MAEVILTEDISKKIGILSLKLRDMTPFFRDLADAELSSTKFRYIAEEDPQGKRWPDPFTVRRDGGNARRSQQFRNPWGYVVASNYHAAPPGYHFFSSSRGDKIMRDTGTLFSSIGRAYGKDYAIVGTNVEYAEKNQNGEGVKKREFLGINKKTFENVQNLITFYLGGSR